MATESLFPDGEVGTTTNFTGDYTNVDDTQASPGSDWMDPTNDALDNEVTFSMQLPTGDLNTGAGLQSIKVHIRKQLTGGNDPTFDAHIREAGSSTDLATLVTGQTITSDTGENFTFTWDAVVLATISGADVEVHFFGHRSGGGPTVRRNLSIGAVEWVADFTSGTTTFKTLTYSGTGTIALTKKVEKTLAITAVGTSSITKLVSKILAVTSVGSSTVIKQIEKVITISATGTLVFTKGLLFSIAANMTGIGSSILTSTNIFNINRGFTVVGTSNVAKNIKKILGISGNGANSITKKTEKTLSNTAVGTSSTQDIFIIKHTATITSTGTLSTIVNFIAAGGGSIIIFVRRIAIKLGIGL